MASPSRSVVLAALAATVITGGVFAVQQATSCRPDPDQGEIIEQIKADPLVAAVPQDGQLRREILPPDTCIDLGDRSYPPNIELDWEYTVPAPYSRDQLHQLFDGPAAAGGWQQERTVSGNGAPWVRYCKPIAGRHVTYADAFADDGLVVLRVWAVDCSAECSWMQPRFETTEPTCA